MRMHPLQPLEASTSGEPVNYPREGDLDRSAGCFGIDEDGVLGVNTSGGPTG
jgi:hypothetical protein